MTSKLEREKCYFTTLAFFDENRDVLVFVIMQYRGTARQAAEPAQKSETKKDFIRSCSSSSLSLRAGVPARGPQLRFSLRVGLIFWKRCTPTLKRERRKARVAYRVLGMLQCDIVMRVVIMCY